MWLTDELKTSHQTINQFIKERLKGSIEEILHELNRYTIKKEQIDLEKLYIDGKKIEANVNKYTFVWKGLIEKHREKLYQKITKHLKSMNEKYQEMGIFFSIETMYEVETLLKIERYLDNETKQSEIAFVYGKGKRKTAFQIDFENLLFVIVKKIKLSTLMNYKKKKKELNALKIIKSSFRYSPF